MMKKYILLLLTLVPIAVGYLSNTLWVIPWLGNLFFTIAPWATLVFWFFLGSKFAETSWNVVVSTLIANVTGILSLVVYVWQFWFVASEARNIPLAMTSQWFSASVPMYFFGRIVLMFTSQTDAIMLAMQVISVAVMLLVFLCGYWMGKRRAK